MKHKALTIGRLSLLNLRQKPLRTVGLTVITAILSFVLFAGAILSVSMKNGLESVKARLGADLMKTVKICLYSDWRFIPSSGTGVLRIS